MADLQLFDIASFNTAALAAPLIITATTSGAPQTVVTMTTASLPAGTYNIGYSFQVTHAAQNRPLYFKINGTYADANFFVNESGGNNALNMNRSYFYPKVHGGGVITIGLAMYEPTATATIDFADVICGRLA